MTLRRNSTPPRPPQHLILLAFLLAFLLPPLPGVALRAAAAGPAPSAVECARCHPGPAADWERGAMARAMDCTACHGDGHRGEADVALVKDPTPNTCRTCHPDQVASFGQGKHSQGWLALQVVPQYRKVPSPARSTGCEGCHQVGQVWADGSRGKCNTCHGRHTFSKKEAAEPEACAYCHRGDHPQAKIWEGSRHGQLYLQTRDEKRAPKCQTCHMPQGNHGVVTAWGFLGLRSEEPDQEWAAIRQPVERALKDLGPANAPGIKRETFAEWQAARQTMIDTCADCHSRTFAQTKLETADAHLKESDRLFGKVAELTYALRDREVIDDLERGSFVREALAHRLSAFMGAFHGAYEFAWDEGYLALSDDLLHLKGDAEQSAILKAIKEKLKLKPSLP